MNRYLTEKDKQDAKKINDIFLELDEKTKDQAMIYLSALRDKQMIDQAKNAAT